MDSENSVIYGLEFQSRALAAQLNETEKIKFITGTQSLKQASNQVHVVEFVEENSTLHASIFYHTQGEIWKINSSPLDSSKISTCYNYLEDENSCRMKTAIFKFPEKENPDAIDNLEVVNELDTSDFGTDVKTTEFHPTIESKAASVTENKILIWDLTEYKASISSKIELDGKNSPKFTNGKWNPHQNCNQFTTATDTHLKSFDVRTGEIAWHVDNAHNILLRDLDYNMNKQYHVATCGDDGFVKIWDYRQPTQPVFSRSDHTHWIWSVRFNPFHDQLLLTASSDSRVLLSSAASVSSENPADLNVDESSDEIESKQMISDGPLQWVEHEDSVYCGEWSPAEPWIFASLSHDGRLLISRVKKSLKYQIML